MLPQQYCLRWRYHHSNLQTMFSQLLERQAFCDVTLACEGRTIKAHKIVLSACSTYFETILSQYEEKDPILIMKDVKYIDIKCLVEFMYKGEINVEHCHLATLLKTAEELRIKGLAEVSWKDEEQTSSVSDGNVNGIQTAIPQVTTVMDTPSKYDPPPNKKKRGRPPIDDYDSTFTTPRISNVQGTTDETYSNDAMSSSEHDLNIWEDDQANDHTDNEESPIKVKKEISQEEDLDDRSNNSFSLQNESSKGSTNTNANRSTNVTTSGGQSFLTPQIEKEWPDVIKMNEYLNTGRRQQFWEEPFTKRVMDAIKTKNLEMKVAAELLGVSYGTLYGRYRDSYGCLKHPYRVRDFWTEQGPTDVLLKLKRKEITLFRAAEQLNVTPQTLSNYLISMSQIDNPDNSSVQSNQGESYEEGTSEDEADSILPDIPSNNTNVFKNLVTPCSASGNRNSPSGNSVLAHCPDITIIKKEKLEGKVNNNSDHSESNSDK
ncbi:protein tramtrack, beta isoform isoform X2 [Cylas formicarius]|uniref:protein tramtrack, beta isoform isoform X2 n=1 Tax=Cylas formicarius TaxID=197179 RepID=UPI0029583377|nr:protein tramtrack, beta isoform isoform X2 [Cylas formicarius]